MRLPNTRTVRLPDDLFDIIVAEAERTGRTITGQVRWWVELGRDTERVVVETEKMTRKVGPDEPHKA